MPIKSTHFADVAHDDLLIWFRSTEAGDLQFDQLHSVAQEALTNYQDEFTDPFPRIESHGHYVFGMFAAPTSIEDNYSDFYTVLFLATFEQIVTVLRVSQMATYYSSGFDIAVVERDLHRATDIADRPDWSVGMAIARVANVFVKNLEKSLSQLKQNVISDLELVTSESRQIPSSADAEYLSELYRRTAVHKTEVVSLKTVLEETKNLFKSVVSDQVDVRRSSDNRVEDLFPQAVEVSVNDLLMRTRHLTSIRNNLESDLELMFERFQEIQSSQQTAVGRRFTGVVSILLLPQLIAGYFGQNFDKTPGYRDDLGWLYSLGLIALVSAIQFYWFKKKKYL